MSNPQRYWWFGSEILDCLVDQILHWLQYLLQFVKFAGRRRVELAFRCRLDLVLLHRPEQACRRHDPVLHVFLPVKSNSLLG